MLKPFKLEPTYRDYVWGGNRLRTDEEITAEAWVVYEKNKITTGPYTDRTLEEVTGIEGVSLIGVNAIRQTGPRFPILIKLLDCARWLSLQVHPNDEQAQRLEGPGHFGKTEAWYVVDADENAQLLSGFRHEVSRKQIREAVGKKTILDLVARQKVKAGDYVLMRPGTIHALGPGLLIYEVQQTSDITYRVYDWDRQKTGRRKLHIEQAIDVLDPDSRGAVCHKKTSVNETSRENLVTCKYFSVNLVSSPAGTVQLDTQRKSFFAVTVLEGSPSIHGECWSLNLNQFESVLIPAVCGHFSIHCTGKVLALTASVP